MSRATVPLATTTGTEGFRQQIQSHLILGLIDIGGQGRRGGHFTQLLIKPQGDPTFQNCLVEGSLFCVDELMCSETCLSEPPEL